MVVVCGCADAPSVLRRQRILVMLFHAHSVTWCGGICAVLWVCLPSSCFLQAVCKWLQTHLRY